MIQLMLGQHQAHLEGMNGLTNLTGNIVTSLLENLHQDIQHRKRISLEQETLIIEGFSVSFLKVDTDSSLE